MNRIRLGAVALAATGVLFLLYPAFRPWHDETTVSGAIASMTSARWVAAHLFAMIGFILMPLGLLALHRLLSGTRGERLTAAAVVTSWIGAGLTLPYYGAEDFALHAVAQKAVANPSIDLLNLVDAVRFGSVAATTFALGLILLGVGAVLAAVAIWRTAVLPRASGIPFAVGFALFIPQFYLPAAARIAHGVLILIGSVWLAAALWRAEEPTV
jgi:hypothetical protein